MEDLGPARWDLSRRATAVLFAVLLALQAGLGFSGIADDWARGHNGWNSAAYHQAAKNTLRWGNLFPVQYYTGAQPPKPHRAYTHAPLGLHLHTTASVWLFGDHEVAVRLVPAIHGTFAFLALFALVRRHWSRAHACLAGAVYVALPINAIYTNMSNHASGYIAWSLVTFHVYLELARRLRAREEGSPFPWGHFAGLLGAYAMTAFWDWPANYVALGIALHWFGGLARRSGTQVRAWRARADEFLGLVCFSAVVLGLFVGHFVLVKTVTGSLTDLFSTIEARQALAEWSFDVHVKLIPPLMFSPMILGLVALWMLGALARAAGLALRARDLVPITYALGGITHYWIFKRSAMVHSYWAWHSLPFVAIAASTVAIALARGAGAFARAQLAPWPHAARWLSGLVAGLALMILMPFAEHAWKVVPEGRRVGGAMWFVVPERGPVQKYTSGRPELRFAKAVRGWTNRSTGVMVHPGFNRFILEPRWSTTLDRATLHVASMPGKAPKKRPGLDGWVGVGVASDFTDTQLFKHAMRHPLYFFDRYFMVDYRSKRTDVQVWRVAAAPPNRAHWLWVTPFEPPVEVTRNRAEEGPWLQEIRRLKARRK